VLPIHQLIQVFLDAETRSFFVRVVRGSQLWVREIGFSQKKLPSVIHKLIRCQKLAVECCEPYYCSLQTLTNCVELSLTGVLYTHRVAVPYTYILALPQSLNSLILGEGINVTKWLETNAITCSKITRIEVRTELMGVDLRFLDCLPHLTVVVLHKLSWTPFSTRHLRLKELHRQQMLLKNWQSKNLVLQFQTATAPCTFDWHNPDNNQSEPCAAMQKYFAEIMQLNPDLNDNF
jgi:hypothetical protein